MKKNLIRGMALLLVLLMLGAALAACKKPNQDTPQPDDNGLDNSDSSESEPAETDIYEEVRGLEYGGRKFKILTYDAGVQWNPYIMEVKEGTQVLNQAAYLRNSEVEQLLDVKIDTVLAQGTEVVEYVYQNQHDTYQ